MSIPAADYRRMKLKTAAAVYDLTYQELWTAVRAGDLPALLRGSRWSVTPDDVEAWLERTGTTNRAAS